MTSVTECWTLDAGLDAGCWMLDAGCCAREWVIVRRLMVWPMHAVLCIMCYVLCDISTLVLVVL